MEKNQEYQEKQIDISGLKVNYKISGEGPVILILHGWGGSSDSWIRVLKLVAMAGFKVIVPDFPGFGKSITPPEPWGIEDYTNLISKFTKDLGLENIFLLGHSFGGRITVKFSTTYPEKIKKIILCDSAGIRPKSDLKAMIIFLMAKIGNTIFSPGPLVRMKDWARNIFYVFLRHKDYVKAEGTMRETIKKVFEQDLLPELPKIKIKTLIVWGAEDKMVPLRYGRVFKEKIENSEMEILPKVGHSPHLECPEKLAGIIINFLRK